MDIEQNPTASQEVQKPDSFRKLETVMAALFAVPKAELEERLEEEKRKSRKRTDLTHKPAK